MTDLALVSLPVRYVQTTATQIGIFSLVSPEERYPFISESSVDLRLNDRIAL